MSALDFTTPSAEVPASSAMEPAARRARGQLVGRDGWVIASDYGDPAAELRCLRETVGFTDRSALCKLELHASPPVLGELVTRAGASYTLGSGVRSADAWWCGVSPSCVLALAEPAAAAALRARVSDAGSELGREHTVTVIDQTCGLAAMSLTGPLGRELLARFCALDVRPAITPVAAFRPGSIARTPGYLLRETDDTLLLMIGWALGHYLWTTVADAAQALGGGPVGADALEEHRRA